MRGDNEKDFDEGKNFNPTLAAKVKRRYLYWGYILVKKWTHKKFFGVIDENCKALLLYSRRAAHRFDPFNEITNVKCKRLISLHNSSILIRKDLDDIRKSLFYFNISNIPGRPFTTITFASKGINERNKWVEKLYSIAIQSNEVLELEKANSALEKQLNAASSLLKLSVGEKLLQNIISGKYDIGSKRIKTVKLHLDEYFESWERVMGHKNMVHEELMKHPKVMSKLSADIKFKALIPREKRMRLNIKEDKNKDMASTSADHESENSVQTRILNKLIASMAQITKEEVRKYKLTEPIFDDLEEVDPKPDEPTHQENDIDKSPLTVRKKSQIVNAADLILIKRIKNS